MTAIGFEYLVTAFHLSPYEVRNAVTYTPKGKNATGSITDALNQADEEGWDVRNTFIQGECLVVIMRRAKV